MPIPEDATAAFEKLNAQIKKGASPPNHALEILGNYIDAATDHKDDSAAEKAIATASVLTETELLPTAKTLLYYFTANAWAIKDHIENPIPDAVWEWKQEVLEQQLYCLRQACTSPGFTAIPKEQQACIYTNLANLLDRIGRFSEAPENYDKAIALIPEFGMAIANKARALLTYARHDYDSGHRLAFLYHSHELCQRALTHPLPEVVRNGLRHEIGNITRLVGAKFLNEPKEEVDILGDSPEEIAYRKWCLSNHLFLNPINDIGPLQVAAHDPLLLPDITTDLNEPPWFLGLFNQLKQEYISARYFYYSGISSEQNHFSDKGVYLVNTLDYTAHSLAIEKTKISFRMSYSIFDKIAYFLNEYFKLEFPERNIYFNTIWYKDGNYKKGLNSIFQARKNLPLRGLYWLSRDLFEENAPFVKALEPDAKKLRSIRNHLEHKYIKIQDHFQDGHDQNPMSDLLAERISRTDFTEKTFRILHLTRAALIYLSFAINKEEEGKRQSQAPTFIAPMPTDILRDTDKI